MEGLRTNLRTVRFPAKTHLDELLKALVGAHLYAMIMRQKEAVIAVLDSKAEGVKNRLSEQGITAICEDLIAPNMCELFAKEESTDQNCSTSSTPKTPTKGLSEKRISR